MQAVLWLLQTLRYPSFACSLGILNEMIDRFDREKQTTVDVVRREEAQQEGLQSWQCERKCN